jgi:arylsulfatase A-like enzyme
MDTRPIEGDGDRDEFAGRFICRTITMFSLLRILLIIAAGLTIGPDTVACPAGPTATDGTRPPNIVLIMADDLGWKDLRCYGNGTLDTPWIDGLASRGIRFTDAYAAAPVCTPTRAALITGLAPARLQITNHAPGHPDGFVLPGTRVQSAGWTRHLPLQQVTLAEKLREAGYATGFFGKWHLSYRPAEAEDPQEPDLRPEHQGFDINVGGCQFGGPPSYFAPFRNPAMESGDETYLPNRLAGECIRFVKQHADQPFFVCWWNYSVHYPFQAPDSLVRKYEDRKRESGMDIRNPVYAAMIEGMDTSIGRLLQALDDLQLTDNTLVIFTSDNGPFAADVRPLRGEKGHLYEGGIRVPLIIRWPGVVSPGSQCSDPVISMDLFATMAGAAGLSGAISSLDGVDLRPLLSGSGRLDRDALFFHYPNYAFHKDNRLGSAIRQGDFKLLYFYDDRSLELYDLSVDIGEQENLATALPDRARRMKQSLDAWLVETGARLPQPVDE